MDELDSEQLEVLHEDLISLRRELQDHLSLSREAARPVDLEEPIGRISRVDAMQQQRMLAASRDAARFRLQQVDAALRRCETDEYGDCVGCGEPIGSRRLRARPEAALCVDCQGRSESRS